MIEITIPTLSSNGAKAVLAVTGCPNDCGKVRMHDFGVMGMTEPQLDPNRCISCGACVKKCQKKSVGAEGCNLARKGRGHVSCLLEGYQVLRR